MTDVWDLSALSFTERAMRAFDLIQDAADFVAFDASTCEAVLQAQERIEETIWNLEEDVHFYDEEDTDSFYS